MLTQAAANRCIQAAVVSRTSLVRAASSGNPKTKNLPLSRGFLAGLHAHATGVDHPEYDSFDSAYEAISQVPDTLLLEFEEELLNGQGRKFIFGSRLVSVIDTTKDTDSTTLRTLVLNERPNLVQTAVLVPGPAGSQFTSDGAPSPITETHLGGLALALLFLPPPKPQSSTSCVIVGAGGCTLPHTISRHIPRPSSVVALEPCEEVCTAARKWFGITPDCGFQLIPEFGEPYLSAQPAKSVNVLILDADDGSVPPKSMQTSNFWSDVVRPVLHDQGVVGVNVIGDEDTQLNLQDTLATSLPNHNITRVAAPVEADVDCSRHSLLFATPQTIDADDLEFKLRDCPVVSDAQAWLREIRNSQIIIKPI